IARAARSAADVIVLDLVEFVAEEDKPGARGRVEAAIRTAQAGGAEGFAQVDRELLVADLHACAWPGLTGGIVWQLESAEEAAGRARGEARYSPRDAGDRGRAGDGAGEPGCV